MHAKERKIPELIMAHLRNLERQGLITSSLDPDGQVRWRITEKLRERPIELDRPQDLDS